MLLLTPINTEFPSPFGSSCISSPDWICCVLCSGKCPVWMGNGSDASGAVSRPVLVVLVLVPV